MQMIHENFLTIEFENIKLKKRLEINYSMLFHESNFFLPLLNFPYIFTRTMVIIPEWMIEKRQNIEYEPFTPFKL